MREIYFNTIYYYGPLIAAIISLSLFLLFLNKNLKNTLSRLSPFFLLLVTLLSLEFYPFQLFTFPLNLIIPIGVILIFILKSKSAPYPRLINSMIIIFTLYLIFGLGALSASSNTWGDGPAPYGVFIVSNTLIILSTLYTFPEKSARLFMFCKFFISIGGFAFVIYSTNGFYYGDYDWKYVTLRRYITVAICITAFIEGILIYFQKKQLQNTSLSD